MDHVSLLAMFVGDVIGGMTGPFLRLMRGSYCITV